MRIKLVVSRVVEVTSTTHKYEVEVLHFCMWNFVRADKFFKKQIEF
jgi:hypothetical protein